MGSKSRLNEPSCTWRPVTGGVQQACVLGPVGFHILINDTMSAFSSSLHQMAAPFSKWDSRSAIQRELDTLKELASRNVLKLNTDECHILLFGRSNPLQGHNWCSTGWEAALPRCTWGCQWVQAGHDAAVCAGSNCGQGLPGLY